jgi:hypothetical protein
MHTYHLDLSRSGIIAYLPVFPKRKYPLWTWSDSAPVLSQLSKNLLKLRRIG